MTEEQIKIFSEQIEFCYGNVEWSHKIHEKAADIFSTICSWKGWVDLFFSFIVGLDVLSQIRAESPIISWALVVSSAILAFSQSVSKAFNFEKRRDEHIATAKSLWEIRETYRNFKTDILAGLYDIERFTQKRDEMQHVTSEIYKQAPRTFDWAYDKADKDFKKGKVTFDHLSEK